MSKIKNEAAVGNVLMTARMSPWKSGSRSLVLRKNARVQVGSICSITDIRWDNEYERDLHGPDLVKLTGLSSRREEITDN